MDDEKFAAGHQTRPDLTFFNGTGVMTN